MSLDAYHIIGYEENYKVIHLGVIAGNAIAFDLYIKCGFEKVGAITYLKKV